MGPVANRSQFERVQRYIKSGIDEGARLVCGGHGRPAGLERGYFIRPTVFADVKPTMTIAREEIFGPVLTVYIYPANSFEKTLDLVDNTSPYALTGSIIARDRAAVELATHKLRNAAGNFYINDKPTGAVVGQQPFGGARASGTNDKAGAKMNLMRWVSARVIKETFAPPQDYRYPFLD